MYGKYILAAPKKISWFWTLLVGMVCMVRQPDMVLPKATVFPG